LYFGVRFYTFHHTSTYFNILLGPGPDATNEEVKEWIEITYREKGLDYRPLLKKKNLAGEKCYGFMRLMGVEDLISDYKLAKKEATIFLKKINQDWDKLAVPDVVDLDYLKNRFRPPNAGYAGKCNYFPISFPHSTHRIKKNGMACV